MEADHEKPDLDESSEIDKLTPNDDLAVDVHNRDAVKGDESDGRVIWTPKQIIATICLAGLYVGE